MINISSSIIIIVGTSTTVTSSSYDSITFVGLGLRPDALE
jgi:hypothetical protein